MAHVVRGVEADGHSPLGGKARALLVNSGNANAFTGKRGRETVRLLLGILTVLGTLLSDLLLMWIDPRIRLGRGR